jgi:hypothetical protein
MLAQGRPGELYIVPEMRVASCISMTDSLYLALMILTFFIPLVIYFVTCTESARFVAMEREKERDKQERARQAQLKSHQPAPSGPSQAIHPVLRQNCAVARLVSQIHVPVSQMPTQMEAIDLRFY